MRRDEFYRAALSGKVRGPAGFFVSFILILLSFPYAFLVFLRNFLYDRGILGRRGVGVPVISVGNITAGGTGKTPLVAWLAAEAKGRGIHTAVVARGYKGEIRDGELINDEGLLLKEAVPGVIVVQDPDRVAAARRAVGEHGAELIILDDAFQHRRIERDVDVVTLDASAPFGNGRLLPAGLLREPVSGLGRANVLVLTRCEKAPKGVLKDLEPRLKRISGNAALFFTDHEARRLSAIGEEKDAPLASLRGKKVFLCSGIASPIFFEETIADLGADVAGRLSFNDHHRYGPDDVRRVNREAAECGAEAVVVTAKDAVKLGEFPGAKGFLVLHIAVRFRQGEDAFREAVFSGKADARRGT